MQRGPGCAPAPPAHPASPPCPSGAVPGSSCHGVRAGSDAAGRGAGGSEEPAQPAAPVERRRSPRLGGGRRCPAAPRARLCGKGRESLCSGGGGVRLGGGGGSGSGRQRELLGGSRRRGVGTAAALWTGALRDSFGLEELQLRPPRLPRGRLGAGGLARAGIPQLCPPDEGELLLARRSINPGGLAQLAPPAAEAHPGALSTCLEPAGLCGAVASQEGAAELVAPAQHVLEGLLQGSPHRGASDQPARGLGPCAALGPRRPPQGSRRGLLFQAGPCGAASSLRRRLRRPPRPSSAMGSRQRRLQPTGGGSHIHGEVVVLKEQVEVESQHREGLDEQQQLVRELGERALAQGEEGRGRIQHGDDTCETRRAAEGAARAQPPRASRAARAAPSRFELCWGGTAGSDALAQHGNPRRAPWAERVRDYRPGR